MTQKNFKYDIIANKIIEEIASGKYKPGDKLPPESELIKMYDVSRVTLRESLKKLSMMGIVSILQGDGTYIKEITPSDFMKPLFPLLALKSNNIADIYEVRIYLESGISEIAARSRTEEDLEKLEDLLVRMESCFNANDFSGYSTCDYQFHTQIAISSHNDIFYNIYKLFEQFSTNYVPKINNSSEVVADSLQVHHQLYYAIKHKRKNLASILMHEHLRLALDNLMAEFPNISDFSRE